MLTRVGIDVPKADRQARSATVARRVKTIPAMLGVTAAALATAPAVVPALAAYDLLVRRPKLPLTRTYLFGLQYLLNDSLEIVVAPALWACAGFGTRLESPASIRRHQRLQTWSLRVLEKRASQLLGLRVELDRPVPPVRFPAIVVSRHVSVFDSSLPALVLSPVTEQIRGVMMAEMLADAGMDIVYGRLGSVFIARDDGPAARSAIASMTHGAPERTAYVVFPEGRLFRTDRLVAALERLRDTDPQRAGRLSQLKGVLPPRVGGLSALLDALPNADVIVLRHHGLDEIAALTDLATSAPLNDPIVVGIEVIPRASIPGDHASRLRWLDDLWLQLDRSMSGATGPQS